MFFERVPAAEYRGDSAIDRIELPFPIMRLALGEPHRNGEPDFPDDGYKVDVCWCVRSVTTPGDIVAFWNYKTGPAYNGGQGSVEDLDYFSVWYSNASFWAEIHSYLVAVAAGELRGIEAPYATVEDLDPTVSEMPTVN